MRKPVKIPISKLQIGYYVFASRWGDRCPLDPWGVGYVSEIHEHGFRLKHLNSASSFFRHAWLISGIDGQSITSAYEERERLRVAYRPTWITISKVIEASK